MEHLISSSVWHLLVAALLIMLMVGIIVVTAVTVAAAAAAARYVSSLPALSPDVSGKYLVRFKLTPNREKDRALSES